MTSDDGKLWRIGEEVIARLDGINSIRERALSESRQVIRLSANATRAVHRHDFDAAIELLEKARAMRDSLEQDLHDYPNIYWSGYVLDSQKEYAESRITLGIISRKGIPAPDDLNVEDAVFLNGLGEAAGELRRYALDSMRRHDLERAEEMLAAMDEIYDLLVSVDYPDAVTGGLRRTTDMVRGVLERTRGDLTMALRQRELTNALSHAEEVLRVDRSDSE
jgi:translin